MSRVIRALAPVVIATWLTAGSIDVRAQPDRPSRHDAKPRASTSRAIGPPGARPAATSPRRGAASATQPPRATSSGNLDPRLEQQRQAEERARLTERLAELKRQIAAGEKSRAGTATALARAERELAAVEKRLDRLNERQRALRTQVADLDRQRTARESDVAAMRVGLARTVVEREAARDRDPLALALTGRDPGEPLLVDAWLEALERAQADRVEALQGRVADLETQRRRADDEGKALAAQESTEAQARSALVADRLAQRDALSKLAQRIAEQRKSATALQNDERRLTRVVQELQRVIERRAAEERARQEAARRDAKRRADEEAARARKRERGERAPRRETPARPAPVPDVEPETPIAGSGDFARHRGSLRMPVRGTIVASFGTPRGTAGASWKGLFIRSDEGADVRAVAAGRVVFADHLRGFGNLVIVDHGEQYLSIYGNNDALRRRSGDAVGAGDVIAVAGNSSGDDQTGLYFELRFRGRPFDPAPWLGSR